MASRYKDRASAASAGLSRYSGSPTGLNKSSSISNVKSRYGNIGKDLISIFKQESVDPINLRSYTEGPTDPMGPGSQMDPGDYNPDHWGDGGGVIPVAPVNNRPPYGGQEQVSGYQYPSGPTRPPLNQAPIHSGPGSLPPGTLPDWNAIRPAPRRPLPVSPGEQMPDYNYPPIGGRPRDMYSAHIDAGDSNIVNPGEVSPPYIIPPGINPGGGAIDNPEPSDFDTSYRKDLRCAPGDPFCR